MIDVRDLLAEWLILLIPWAFIIAAAVTLFWVGRVSGSRQAHAEWETYLARVSDVYADTMPIPSHRPASQ